jgi:hypothetical protein
MRVGLCQKSGRGHRGMGGDGERRDRESGRDDIQMQMLCWSCGGISIMHQNFRDLFLTR